MATNETTLRMAAARRKIGNASEIATKSGLDYRTVIKMYDEIPNAARVESLRKVAEALGLVLVIRFEEPADNGQA